MRKLGPWLLAAAALNGGCLSFVHPCGRPRPEQVQECALTPACCRNHVYVFFVQGFDPFGAANLSGVRDYVQSLGFIKTYYGQLYHAGFFGREVRRLHNEDPDAHFVLVGYNLGADAVRSLAQNLQTDSIFVDVVVYLEGDPKQDGPRTRPANVGRVVNIAAKGWFGNAPTLDDAVNVRYTDVSSFGSPAHEYTLETLAHELTSVAGLVPATDPLAPAENESRAPMPRASSTRDEWDFLKLRTPGEDSPPPAPAPVKPKDAAPPPSTVGRI